MKLNPISVFVILCTQLSAIGLSIFHPKKDKDKNIQYMRSRL